MRGSREGGSTLAEVLVTVAILGITFVAIIGGLGTAILTSDIDRRQANAQNGLRTFAEQVRSEAYVACPAAPSYGSSYSAPASMTKTVTVEYWVALTDTYVGVCPLTDDGLQRITLTLASTDDRVREPVVIFKRRS